MGKELNLEDIEVVKEKLTELKQQDKWDEVREIQEKMLERNPNNIRAIWDLIRIASQKGEKKIAKKYIEKVLAFEPNDKKDIKYLKTVLRYSVQMAKEYRDWNLLKSIQARRLELQPRSLSALCDLTIQAKKVGDWKRAEELQLKIIELSPDNEKAWSSLKQIRKALTSTEISEMTEEDFSIESQVTTKQEGITEIRAKLYAGEIEEGEIKEIAEKFRFTAQGTVLIAEVCTYLGRQNLAIQALKSYLAEHKVDMTDKEKNILKGAMEIARGKQKIKNPLQWASKYVEESSEGNR